MSSGDVLCSLCDGTGWARCSCVDEDGTPEPGCEVCEGLGLDPNEVCHVCDGAGGYCDDERVVLDGP